MDGFCFNRLVVVMTSILRFIHPREFATAEDKRAFQEEQQWYLQVRAALLITGRKERRKEGKVTSVPAKSGLIRCINDT